MRLRALLIAPLFLATVAGCASTPPSAQPGLPGLAAYYEQATAPHRRAVRKPIRDQRERALAALADKSAELLAESESWDSDARLVGLAEPERAPARAAVADFRAALSELRAAARRDDLPAVEHDYGRALASYRQLLRTLPAAP